jgi:hypothetical protein
MKNIIITIQTLVLSVMLIPSFAQNLTGIEAIEYDPIQGRFIVSNGNNVIHVNSTGNGVAVLPSPIAAAYGMEVMNNQLYAIHSNSVKVFDLTNGNLLSTVSITGAGFLNGMASNGTNLIWVTDFSAKKIHQIDFTDLTNPVTTTLISNTTSTPNGIVWDGANNRLVFVSWGNSAPIKTIDLSNNAMTTAVTTSLGNCDGIDMDGNGNFFVASWSPNRITKFNNDFSVNEIITVAGGLSSAADICYALENDTLAIPNSGNNTVVYVGFNNNPIFTEEVEIESFQIQNSGNQWEIIFENTQHNNTFTLKIYDALGQCVISEKENLSSGKNRWVIPNETLSNGSYIIQLYNGKRVFTQKCIK